MGIGGGRKKDRSRKERGAKAPNGSEHDYFSLRWNGTNRRAGNRHTWRSVKSQARLGGARGDCGV